MTHNRLVRDITLVLVAKLLLLSMIYALCFSPSHRSDPAGGLARIFLTPAQG